VTAAPVSTRYVGATVIEMNERGRAVGDVKATHGAPIGGRMSLFLHLFYLIQ
jgi:hypothetical protein